MLPIFRSPVRDNRATDDKKLGTVRPDNSNYQQRNPARACNLRLFVVRYEPRAVSLIIVTAIDGKLEYTRGAGAKKKNKKNRKRST